MNVTRDGVTVEPLATFDISDTESLAYKPAAFYVVKPGDVITVTGAGEAKGGDVKAGYDVKSDCIDTDGEVTHPIQSVFGSLPASYTVAEHDVYIYIYNQRS